MDFPSEPVMVVTFNKKKPSRHVSEFCTGEGEVVMHGSIISEALSCVQILKGVLSG